MIVLYLNNNSYVNSTPFEIINNFESLNEIIIRFDNVNKYFLHNSFYEIDAVINIFIEQNQFTHTVLPQILNRFQTDTLSIKPLTETNELDARFPNQNSAFFGVFSPDKYNNIRHITNIDGYSLFINQIIEKSYSPLYWTLRETFFPHLSFCPSTEHGLASTPCYKDVIAYLIRLEAYFCQEGTISFDWVKMREITGMDISPESSQTMGNAFCRSKRVFSLPDGSTEIFSLHLKPKDARIYILHKGENIYIGYIGKHLPTIEFPH